LIEVSNDQISHIGIIKSINNQHLIVKITSQTACSSCHAQGSCISSEQAEKEIEIPRDEENFNIGEMIEVITSTSQGYKAVVFAYLLPLLLLVLTLLAILSMNGGEAAAALGSLMILLPYYWFLYSFKEKIKSSFHFMAQKMPAHSKNE
jgi:sigma-E factor negative regulatory protein RseC